jgi:uracil-DNA glycosylase
VWVTNSALCRARKIKLSTGAVLSLPEVKARAARACRRRLLKELIQVDPVVIVPLGNWALWSLSDIPNARIYAYRGSRSVADLPHLLELVEQGLARSPMRQVKEEGTGRAGASR